jgi:hypothetical protein
MDDHVNERRRVCDLIDLRHLVAPVVRDILSADPIIVVVKDVTRLIADFQGLLHQGIVTPGTVGAVEVKRAIIIIPVSFGIISNLAYELVDGVNALTDIGLRVIVDSLIMKGVDSQRV